MTNPLSAFFKPAVSKPISPTDMTDEATRQAENRKIAEARARTDAILSSIGDGVIAISDKGEISFINNQAMAMLGITESDALGKHLIHAVPAYDDKNQLPLERHPMQQSLLNGAKNSVNLYFCKKDGSKFPVAVTTSPVFLMGALVGGVLVFRDITHEKDVDRMKTEFISLASHQLRTPLSAMKWFAEILLSGDAGKITQEQEEMVKKIYISNERMIDLVNSLLNISRIESGRIIIDPRPTDLSKLVGEVLGELAPKIEKKKHHVAVSVHADLPAINIDPRLVRHVYLNLLTNAIKYTPESGEIHVLISKNADSLVSQVTDSGMGIPAGQQNKVFQKFFRAENVSRVETDGSGLGLYLVKSIVDASGGKIWFKSEVGKGTTFWFSLPLAGSMPKEGEVTINS